jgi:hypothetical protein
MPKIILQASTFQKNYDITTVAISPEEYKKSKTVAMDIIPRDGFSVNAKNFFSGYLSKKIVNVSYKNSDNNVRISVVLQGDLLSEGGKNVAITIPVNGFAEVPSNILEFVDNTSYGGNVQVIDRLGSITRVSGSVNNQTRANTYSVVGRKNEAGVLLEKTFIANEGYYFKASPAWTISSIKRKNYTVTSTEVKDSEKRITKKTYTLSYKFPNEITTVKALDKISFTASAVLFKKQRVVKTTADKVEEHKVHSFQVFPSASGKDARKDFIVRGVVGTPFDVLIQDQDKKIYNFKTGAFSEGGTVFSGVIPYGGKNKTYGTYRGAIRTQPQQKGVDVRLMTKEKGIKGTRITTKKIDQGLTASIVANNTGLTGPTLSTATILSDKILPSVGGKVPFIFTITAGDNKVMFLNRKPLIDISRDFLAWSAGSENLVNGGKTFTGDTPASSENTIYNDLDITSGGSSDTLRPSTFKVSELKVIPKGSYVSPGLSVFPGGHDSYVISGVLDVVTIGEENLVVELRLNNFLSEHTIAAS